MSKGIDSIGAVGAAGAIDIGGSRNAVAPSTTPAARPNLTPTPQNLQAALQQVNTHLAAYGRVMELRVDLASGITVATIRNSETGVVLQQMPSEDVLRLAEMLRGWSHGKDALLDLMA